MKWISPVLGLGTWITRFSFDETGRTAGVSLAALGFVGAAATSPAAAIPLRATFKKPLREMSCIASPPCRPTFVEPFGGSVDFLESNVSLGACGTENYSPPSGNTDVPVEVFLGKIEKGTS